MKKTAVIELFANIRKTIISFISITMFVFLGMAVFIGFSWTGMAMKESMDKALKNGNASDIQVSYTYGISEQEAQNLLKLNGVDQVEMEFKAYESFKYNDTLYQASITSYTNTIDTLTILEGSYPNNDKEILIEKGSSENTGIKVGDEISFFDGNGTSNYFLNTIKTYDSEDFDTLVDEINNEYSNLKYDTYKVVGIIEHPYYLSKSQASYGVNEEGLQIHALFFCRYDSFNDEVTNNEYNVLLIRNNSLADLSNYSDEYAEQNKSFKNSIKDALIKINDDGYQLVRSKLDQFLSDAKGKIDDGKDDIDQAVIDIAEAQLEIESNEKKLSDAKTELADAKKQLSAARKELDDAESEIADNRLLLEEQYKLLATSKAAISSEADMYAVAYFEASLQEAEANLDKAQAALDAGIDEYNTNYQKYKKALRKYNNGVQEITDGKSELEQGKDDLSQAQVDLTKAQSDYDKLVEKSEVVKNYGVNIISKNENAVIPYMNLISDIIIRLKYSLGGLFLAISIMVCYSVVARNVNNQIKEIGTKKALGLYDREITISCLAYSFMAIVLGTIPGFLLALFGLERVIVPSVKGSFNFTLYPTYTDFKEFFILFVLELIVMLFVTYLGCRNILKENAVKLLQGKQPPENKTRFFEKSKAWQILSLINKTIVNNCLSDFMRVLATVIGVAGCAALIVSSITLKDNVSKSFAMQYSDYFQFDSFVYFDKENDDAKLQFEKYFDEHNISYAGTYRTLMHIEIQDNPKVFGYAMVYEDSESFRDLVIFDSVFDEFNYKGLWIPESYQKYHDLAANDDITITTTTGDSYQTKIDGYFKYYSYMLQIYMDSETYSRITGEEYKPNIYLVSLNENDYDTVYKDLETIDGFTSMLDYYHYCKADVDIFTSVSTAMVGVYLVVSTLMAIFILLNLIETFIDEKKRELIVLMINGYSIKQANKYIYSDTIFLTIIGLIVGVFIGVWAGNESVAAFEGESLYLIHQVDIYACVSGVIITALLSFIMCKIALKRIREFSLTDINKA